MLLLTEFLRQKSPSRLIIHWDEFKMAIPFLSFQYGVFVTLEWLAAKGLKEHSDWLYNVQDLRCGPLPRKSFRMFL